MRIKESQLRAIVRKEIKALMEIDEKDPEMQNTNASEEQPEEQPEQQPEPEPEEEGPSKATQFAQKIVERLKREPELNSPEAMIDMLTEFLESLGFNNESKLTILKSVKTNTVR